MKKWLLVLLFAPFFAAAQDKLSEKNYRIYSVQQGKEVSLMDVAAAMDNYDVLFFGEEHNDSVTHFLERSMLEALYGRYNNELALSMEMFERDVQPVMDEYLKGFIREKNFIKDARAWSNYRDYKPMVEFAKEKGLDVVCANAAGRYSNLAGRKGQQALGQLPEASKAFFAPLPYDTAQGAYYRKLTGLADHGPAPIADSGKTKSPPVMNMGGFNLVMGQSLWDATMAYSIAQYRKHNKHKKIMQVNGKFHSDEGFAAATQLKKYSPKTRMIIISTASDDNFPNIKWADYVRMGDYIIITDPNVPRTYKD